MPTTVLYTILAILILTTIYVLVRTIIFQRSTGAVGKIDGKRIPVEEMAKMVKCYAQLIQVWGTKEMVLKG